MGVSDLLREDKLEALGRHAGARQHARALHVGGRRHDHDCIARLPQARLVRMSLKQQRDVEHHEPLAVVLRRLEEAQSLLQHER
eukprot:3545839-Prymnesium_polylepis.1